MQMELRHLRYFVALAETGHFGQAAQRLNIVQPALSMQIRDLEEEVGGPLFSRTRQGVWLTAAGEVLLTEARRTLAQAEHARDATRRSLRGEIGRVRVGFAGNAVLSGMLTDALRQFRARFPRAEVSVQEMPPNLHEDALVKGEIDLAYGTVQPPAESRTLRCERIGNWPMVVAMAHDHRLAKRARVPLKVLAAEQIIAFSSDDGDAGLVHLRAHLGIVIEPAFRVSSTLSVLALVAAGLGVALVPRSVEQVVLPGLTYRPVAEVGSAGLLLLSRADESSGAVVAFHALALEVARASGTTALKSRRST
ncbi:LysR substrate-binding domain-containing protein [Paraburkholderia bannensis]|uniref:LysR substrate-binding domain-containing protein n=1 Tax=Paraburkholderia bannensis TaxID=765414 RepID=UPI002AB7EFDB|nr:LysR substrate-binding domain-containing protein [Paraburkholderia bannensis]